MGPAYTEADIDKIELTFFYRIPDESDKNIFYINCYDDIGRKIAVYAVSYDKVLVPFSKEFFASLENETATLGGKIKISSDTENTQNDVQQETLDKKVNLKTLQESRKTKALFIL